MLHIILDNLLWCWYVIFTFALMFCVLISSICSYLWSQYDYHPTIGLVYLVSLLIHPDLVLTTCSLLCAIFILVIFFSNCFDSCFFLNCVVWWPSCTWFSGAWLLFVILCLYFCSQSLCMCSWLFCLMSCSYHPCIFVGHFILLCVLRSIFLPILVSSLMSCSPCHFSACLCYSVCRICHFGWCYHVLWLCHVSRTQCLLFRQLL